MKKILFAMCALTAFCSDMKAQILQQDPETQKCGVLNESTGQWVVKPTFDELGPIVKSEEYYSYTRTTETEWIVPVKNKGLWGIMDDSGKMKIKPKYESIGKVLSFKKTSPGSDKLLDMSVLPVKCKGAWGIVNAKAKECIKPSYEEVLGAFTGKANSYNSDKEGYILLKNHGIYATLKANGNPSSFPGFKMVYVDKGYCIALQLDGKTWVNLSNTDSNITTEKYGSITLLVDSSPSYSFYSPSLKAQPICILENNKIYTFKEVAEQGNIDAMYLWSRDSRCEALDGYNLLLKSALGGNTDAISEIDNSSSGVFRDALKEAALTGNAIAEFLYASCLTKNLTNDDDKTESELEILKEADTWFKKAQAHGYGDNITNRIKYYQKEIEIRENRIQRNKDDKEKQRQEQLRIQKSKQWVKGIAGTWAFAGSENEMTYIIKPDHTYTLKCTNKQLNIQYITDVIGFHTVRVTATLSGTWKYDEENGKIIINNPHVLHSRAKMTPAPGSTLTTYNFVHEFNRIATIDDQAFVLCPKLVGGKYSFSDANTMTMPLIYDKYSVLYRVR